jgi:8-oxo-dGTP pyrophosphatase MutT (NUDIX family)
MSIVTERNTIYSSPWLKIVEKKIATTSSSIVEDYVCIKPYDYVSALIFTSEATIPIVRQYRPATETYTYELPGGLIDKPESPEDAIKREVYEETGLITYRPLLLGVLDPDCGRLENKLFGYFATAIGGQHNDWQPEFGVALSFVSKSELRKLIISGEFKSAQHLAIVGLAQAKGILEF